MNTKSSNSLGSLALFSAGVVGAFAGLGAKIALRELPPFTILFTRIFIMLVVLFPFVIHKLSVFKKNWKTLLLLGLFWSGNVTFFIVGIRYTTVLASGVLYAGVPLLTLIESMMIFHARPNVNQISGIIFGLLGIGILLVDSFSGLSFGSFQGNVLIFLATLSWSLYLLYSKKLSAEIDPLVLTVSSAVVASVIVGIAMMMSEGIAPLLSIGGLHLETQLSLLFLGLGIGVGMIFLYQYGIKYGSVVMASMMLYIGTIVGGLTGIVFLHENLTTSFVVGSVCILFGVYVVSRTKQRSLS
ncbi:DMT family transporter [Candidatus Gottesmanbacteria bacterium]|nr:DMT family transporter [Candidatus Gottesmanbacteria bacterium]